MKRTKFKVRLRDISIFTMLYLNLSITYGQNLNLDWAYGFGDSTGALKIQSIELDPNTKFLYATGAYWGNPDFDPGTDTLFNPSSGMSLFIQRFDSLGSLSWSKSITGSTWIHVSRIICDNQGDIYIAGAYAGTPDMDMGTGTHLLMNPSGPGESGFIGKYKPNGDLIWAHNFPKDINSFYCNDIAIDHSNDIVVTGSFWGTVDFDPGTAVTQLTSYPDGIGNNADIYVMKLDSSGQFKWARHMGGGGFDNGQAITVDTNDNIYVTGHFTDTADFNQDSIIDLTLIAQSSRKVFVQKLDANGNILWAKGLQGAYADEGNGIVSDELGNVYVTGYFNHTANFDPNASNTSLISSGTGDIFLMKLNTNGQFQWANHFGGNVFTSQDMDIGQDIILNEGKILLTGTFGSTSDFDPGNNSFNLISNGGTDVFMALYDSNGNFKGSGSIGGWGNDWVSHIAADNNNIWIAGHYGDPIDMDPDNSSTFILNPKGSSDGFLAKYNLSTVTTTEEMFSNNQVDIYPNPNQGQFSIKSNSQNFSIQIFDVHGKIIKQLENYNNNTVFNIPSVPGIYFLKLKDDNDTIVKKFIVTM